MNKAFILVDIEKEYKKRSQSENCIRYGGIHRQKRLDPIHWIPERGSIEHRIRNN